MSRLPDIPGRAGYHKVSPSSSQIVKRQGNNSFGAVSFVHPNSKKRPHTSYHADMRSYTVLLEKETHGPRDHVPPARHMSGVNLEWRRLRSHNRAQREDNGTGSDQPKGEANTSVNGESPGDRRRISRAERAELRRRIARMFRVTKVICSWCRSMKEQSMQLVQADPGVTQLYFYSSGDTDGASQGVTLAFDKSDYSRASGIRLPLRIRTSATKLPEQRSKDDVTAVYQVLNNVKSFRDRYPEDVKRQLCRVAWYMSCEKERVILRQGHQGLNFYFLYSGSVFVQLETKEPVTGRYKVSRESVIGSGTSFGDLALLVENGTRTVSIICREPSELFQIDRDAFREICSGLYEQELGSKILIARELPVFETMPDEGMSQLCFQSLVLTYPAGKVIERDWSLAKHIYIVTQGRVQLWREVDTSDASDKALLGATTPLPGNLLTKLSHWSRDGKPRVHSASSKSNQIRYGKRYMTVGTLLKGHTSDLRLLNARTSDQIEPIVMVSQGSKMLRISRNLILGMIDKVTVENYLRQDYTPTGMPDQDSLVEKYIKLKHWNQFRDRVTDTVKRSFHGEPIAMIPEHRKLFNHLKVIL